MDAPTPSSTPSAWAPLREPLFRSLWIASFASNVGTLMQSVGASWLMTSLSVSPLLVALVQTATSLPVFILSLPAGALADVVDRRRLLLLTQGWMLLAATALGLVTVAGLITPWLLLVFTFLLGLGAALNAPAWQAIVPELVPPGELASAVAINSAGFNMARAVGPALGGLIVAAFGAGATFMLNAASFLAVLFVLFRWQREVPESILPAERVLGAMRAGMRYVAHAPVLRTVLVRVAGFIVFGSAVWALMPLVARHELKLGAEGYGLLLGSLGLGAVGGALLLPRLRRVMTIDQRVAAATLLYAVGTAVTLVPNLAVACLGLLGAGVAWLVLMAGFNTSVQSVVPEWVRGRALSVYLLIVFGGLAFGSMLWGAVASVWGLWPAMLVPSVGMVVAMVALSGLKLQQAEGLNLAPSMHWPPPQVACEPDPEQGPVFVTIEYWIDPAAEPEFLLAMRDVRRMRLRGGAFDWVLLGDLARLGRYQETFMSESWLQHMRQHERVTMLDRAIEERAIAFHRGPEPPHVSHLLAKELPRRLR